MVDCLCRAGSVSLYAEGGGQVSGGSIQQEDAYGVYGGGMYNEEILKDGIDLEDRTEITRRKSLTLHCGREASPDFGFRLWLLSLCRGLAANTNSLTATTFPSL